MMQVSVIIRRAPCSSEVAHIKGGGRPRIRTLGAVMTLAESCGRPTTRATIGALMLGAELLAGLARAAACEAPEMSAALRSRGFSHA